MTVDSRPATAPMSESEQRGFVVFATWIIAGLFLDGWSHQVDKPESFFTPWHGLMYSGFGAAVLWGIAIGRREEAEASANDKLTTLGVVIFTVGMLGDFGWHELFGIEVNVEALLSPTHLLLMTGGLLLASAPARSVLQCTRQRGERTVASFPVVWSVTATVAVLSFFLQFGSAFRGPDMAAYVRVGGMDVVGEMNAIRGVMAILVTNALFVGAATFVVSHWKTRPGQLSLMLGTVALATSALTSFDHAWLVLAAVAGGALGDAAVAQDRPDLVPVAVPLAMWPVWTLVMAATAPFEWNQNVWGGAIFFAVVSGVGLRILAAGSFRRS